MTDSPSFVPCDIDNDGNMDIIAFDQTYSDSDDTTEGIFLGKGSGAFQKAETELIQIQNSKFKMI